MKKKDMRGVRTGPAKFVGRMKTLFLLFSAVALPAMMIILVFAINGSPAGKIVFGCAGGALALGYLVAYGFFAMRVTMGTAVALSTTDKVVYVTTDRKVFTYDVEMGCVAVKEKRNRYICTFRTQDSQDSFCFYRRAPLSGYADGQFSEADIRSFCPAFDEMVAKSRQKSEKGERKT